METIYDYIRKYGRYSFNEKAITEVDNLILSFLSYADFRDIVPEIGGGTIKLKDASDIFHKKYTKAHLARYLVAVREAADILKELANTKRFRNLELFNYRYKVTRDMQFGAVCIKLPDGKIFVSYEGTDGYVSGWKEDCMLVTTFPLKAHKEAIRYLNRVTHLLGPKIYVGGHSKGGNLALVASMFCRNYIFHKIIKVYSFDGPGLRLNELNSLRYKRVRHKYVHVMPNEGFVGILCRNEDNYTVIKSKNRYFFQHDVTSWIVSGDKFARGEMSAFTKNCRRALDAWLDRMSLAKQEKFIKNLFEIFDKAGVEDFMELRQAKLGTIFKLIKEARNIDKESEKLLSSCFKDLYLEWRNKNG